MTQPFQVVIQTEIYSQHLKPYDDKAISFLSIGNKPLIYYQIEYFEKYGFVDFTLIVSSKNSSRMKALMDQYKGKTKPDSFEYHEIHNENNNNDDDEENDIEDEINTIDIIRKIYENRKIKKDMIWVNCDVIFDEIFDDIIDFHYLNNPGITLVFKQIPIENPQVKKGGKVVGDGDKIQDYDVAIIDSHSKRIIKLTDNKQLIIDPISIQKSSLIKYSNLKIITNIFNCKLAIIKHQIIELLTKNLPNFNLEEYTSFEDDFIPYLINNQFNPKITSLIEKDSDPDILLINQLNSKPEDIEDELSIYGYFIDKPYVKKITTANELMQSNLNCLMKLGDIPKCLIQTENNDIVENSKLEKKPDIKPDVNIVTANDKKNEPEEKKAKDTKPDKKNEKIEKKKSSKGDKTNDKSPIQPEETKKEEKKVIIDIKPEIANSRIGSACEIENKAKIERSIIGSNCIIKPNVKIVNSVILKGTTIQEGSVIENSMIGWKCQIQKNSRIKNSFVGPDFVTGEGQKIESETVSKEDFLINQKMMKAATMG